MRPRHGQVLRAAGLLVAAVPGLLAGVLMPRGPVTTTQVLVSIAVALVVGCAAGYLARTRWAILAAPLAYVAAFELASWPAQGVTVDRPSLEYAWGFIAAVLGRGMHGVVVVPALMVMAAVGAGIARTRADTEPAAAASEPVRRRTRVFAWLRRASVAMVLLGIAAMAVWVAQPAAAPPVLDASGEPVDGSIAELRSVQIGGTTQWITMRGHSTNAPVLLYLPGGPGQSDLGQARVLLQDLEQDFVVVTWDGRGIGRSYPSYDEHLTQRRVVDDTIELTDYLRRRFREERIYLFGESGGTITGVMAVQRAPERYHAWLGSGQMVSPRETDQRIWADLRGWARARDERDVLRELDRVGEPPYDDPLTYAWVMGYYDKLESDWDAPAYYTRRGEESGVGFMGLAASEYAAVDKVNAVRGLMDVFTQLYPTWQDIDLRTSAASLQVPVYIFSGEHELAARRDLSLAWFEDLRAPRKRLYTYPRGGHAAAFENYRAFHAALIGDVLPETYPDQQRPTTGKEP